MPAPEPVTDWATDFDVLERGYVNEPFPVWDELRERCPIAHTDRRLSTWLPTRYADVSAIAHDIDHFSSREIGVIPRGRRRRRASRRAPADLGRSPGAHVDAPVVAAVVLAPARRAVRADDQGPVQLLDRQLRVSGSGRRGGRLRAADSRARHRADVGRSERARRHVHRLGAGRARVRRRSRPAEPRPRRHRHVSVRADRSAPRGSRRRPHQLVAPQRGRRRAGLRWSRARHRRAHADRGDRHDLERDRRFTVASGDAPR